MPLTIGRPTTRGRPPTRGRPATCRRPVADPWWRRWTCRIVGAPRRVRGLTGVTASRSQLNGPRAEGCRWCGPPPPPRSRRHPRRCEPLAAVDPYPQADRLAESSLPLTSSLRTCDLVSQPRIKQIRAFPRARSGFAGNAQAGGNPMPAPDLTVRTTPCHRTYGQSGDRPDEDADRAGSPRVRSLVARARLPHRACCRASRRSGPTHQVSLGAARPRRPCAAGPALEHQNYAPPPGRPPVSPPAPRRLSQGHHHRGWDPHQAGTSSDLKAFTPPQNDHVMVASPLLTRGCLKRPRVAHREDPPLKCPPLTGSGHLYEATAYTDTSGADPDAPEPGGPTDARTRVSQSVQSRQCPEVFEGFEATHCYGIPEDSITRRRGIHLTGLVQVGGMTTRWVLG
jgi:hypothetical protein